MPTSPRTTEPLAADADSLGGGGVRQGRAEPQRSTFTSLAAPPLVAAPGARVQRTSLPELFVAVVTPDRDEAGGLLVEDGAQTLTSGQMRKADFMRQLRTEVCRVAEDELRRAGRSAAGCPYIDQMLSYYEGRSAEHLERAIRRYAPETRRVRNALDYLPVLSARLGRGIARWATTGQMPEESLAALAGARNGLVGAIAGIAGLSRKATPGAEPATVDAGALVRQLGPGQALEGGTQARMERALGHSFAGVRIHADDRAAALSHDLAARAFTIGPHVAFGAGELHPGTPHGDALLAHELAHVVQQGTAAPSGDVPLGAAADPLEHDADLAAAAAVEQLHADAPRRGRPAWPRASSGLRLQRCGSAAPVVATPPQPRPAPDVPNGPVTRAEQIARARQLLQEIVVPPTPAQPRAAGAGGNFQSDLSTLLQAHGAQPPQIASAWTSVQRGAATALGQTDDELSAVDRTMIELLEIADQLENGTPEATAQGLANELRARAAAYLPARLPEFDANLHSRVATATSAAIPPTSTVPPAEIEALVDRTLIVPTFDATAIRRGTSPAFETRNRGALMEGFATYRAGLQRAVEAMVGTRFAAYITGDTSGLHRELLTTADQQARIVADDTARGSGPASVTAGHLRARGTTAALLQQMLRAIYEIQATSPLAYRLVRNLIAGGAPGRPQHRDVELEAVPSTRPMVLGDSFATNEVDPAELESYRDPATRPAGMPTPEGGYIHLLAERQYDATNEPNPLTALTTTARAIQADEEVILADPRATPAIRAALMSAERALTDDELALVETIRPGSRARFQALMPEDLRRRGDQAHNAALRAEGTYYEERHEAPPPGRH